MCFNFGRCLYKPQYFDVFCIGSFRSLINHSCLSNVIAIPIDNKVVTVVTNPVKKGEQIFSCYYEKIGPNQAISRKVCMQVLNFICDCQLCIDNNHQYKPLKLIDPHNFINRKHLELAKELLKLGWHIINTNAMLEDRTSRIIQASLILKVLADYATFPC